LGAIAVAGLSLLLLSIGGCATTAPSEGLLDDGPLGRTAVAGGWNSLTQTRVGCRANTDDCAKAYAAKGDACLRMAIQEPLSASARDSRMRKLLDCADENYREALRRQPSRNAPGRISYHGGLLLTLSERRNRLDDVAKETRLDRENEKLLAAAQAARREVPDNALGYLYGASAYAYRAALKPRGRERCNDLRQAQSLLARSPMPPRELSAEQERIEALVQRQLRENVCSAIGRR
jgi:hypothetical protein